MVLLEENHNNKFIYPESTIIDCFRFLIKNDFISKKFSSPYVTNSLVRNSLQLRTHFQTLNLFFFLFKSVHSVHILLITYSTPTSPELQTMKNTCYKVDWKHGKYTHIKKNILFLFKIDD